MSPVSVVLRALSLVILALALWSIRPTPGSRSFYPLDAGMEWGYEVTSGANPGNAAQLRVSNVGRRAVGIWAAWAQRIETGGRSGYRFVVERPDSIATVGEQRPGEESPTLVDPPVLLLRFPAEVGQSWTADTMTTIVEPGTKIDVSSKIESVSDRVEVPSGVFDGCLRVVSRGARQLERAGASVEVRIETKIWYAPGVGVVQIQRRESSDPDLASADIQYRLVSRR